MTQTLAILLAAYRNLNSRKLFWITLMISAVGVLGFAAIGVNDRGMHVAFWQFDSPMLNSDPLNPYRITPAEFYKAAFVNLGIRWWLSVGAIVLALVSTAGVFPDLISSGSIDLYVCRPISRWRLFLTQYAGSLAFVALQVTVFAAASFLVIGLRGGSWEPGVFLAIPLVTCIFSYLFSVCVLLGIATRSTVAALLLTLLFWFLLFGLNAADAFTLTFKTMKKHGVDPFHMQAEAGRGPGTRFGARSGPQGLPSDSSPPAANPPAESNGWETAYRVIHDVRSVVPKTAETADLMNRWLLHAAHLRGVANDPENRMFAAQKEIVETVNSQSVGWILGTSLAFEAVLLAWGALIFSRRDF
jgi:ABC-type transport system involved in multi-copper enzyme maturation permease subunit